MLPINGIPPNPTTTLNTPSKLYHPKVSITTYYIHPNTLIRHSNHYQQNPIKVMHKILLISCVPRPCLLLSSIRVSENDMTSLCQQCHELCLGSAPTLHHSSSRPLQHQHRVSTAATPAHEEHSWWLEAVFKTGRLWFILTTYVTGATDNTYHVTETNQAIGRQSASGAMQTSRSYDLQLAWFPGVTK